MKRDDQLRLRRDYLAGAQGFHNFMQRRIRDVLLVSSLYDSYIFEEDGRLYELIRNEYQGLNLSHAPEFSFASTGSEALALALEKNRFDLIITTLHIEDMHPLEFAQRIRASGSEIPIVLLALDSRELADLIAYHDTTVFDRMFIWQGDYRLIIAIIKHLEDRMNVDHDTRLAGVQTIILIEDNIRFYSSFLPLIYTEIIKQSQRLIAEGVSLTHRFLRMKARPKILLCSTYEDAWGCFERYQDTILGIISDIEFSRGGKADTDAGIDFAREVKKRFTDIPILLQSNSPEKESVAHEIGASFLMKDSPVLLEEVRTFMYQYFSFGDFVFRMPDGQEVGRARDLKGLEELLRTVPDESLLFHGERNHFSNWLKARTEFYLAHQLRPRKVSDYASLDELRNDLIASLHKYRQTQHRGLITDFSRENFDPSGSFARIGGGSLGGKARGLGFFNLLMHNDQVHQKFKGVEVFIPPGVVVGTDAFDRFLEMNDLRGFAMDCLDDQLIKQRFLEAPKFPRRVLDDLRAFLGLVREPLAVRSSSLLEDSQYQPFAGVYETYMIPNAHPNLSVRLRELVNAIKLVFASTFFRSAKSYITMTSYRLEEEKMAVIIQKMIGTRFATRFYPHFSGVAQSYNFYPVKPQQASDGIAALALGLGKMIVDGGPAVRMCPKYPQHLRQLSTVADTLAHNQHEFFALDMAPQTDHGVTYFESLVKTYDLAVAEGDGPLAAVGSTYSPENDAVYDGISRDGMRLVTFAPLLKNKLLPVAEIVELLLDLGTWGTGTPIEIEFAVNLNEQDGRTKEFGVLQMRPLVISREYEELSVGRIAKDRLLCESPHVLGNGIITGICDAVVVERERFDRSKTHEVALEVGQFNAKLIAEGRPYLLVGFGRWGTLDPWLGVPVLWDQISGARAIVEAGFRDFIVEPSQGSHFFQNLTAFMIGYFTINPERGEGMMDWDWLARRKAAEEKSFTRHLRFEHPLTVRMNGHQHKGIILKPEDE